MEQPTTQSTNFFIPTPIEQQLAAYKLGTLLEVYKRGWLGHDNRHPKFNILVFNLILLAITIVSIMGILSIVQSTHTILIALLFIPFITIIGLVIGVPMLLRPSLCVGAFSNGLLYAKNTQVMVLAWNEIERIELETKKDLEGTVLLLTIYTHAGKSFQVKGPPYQINKVVKIIREKITH
jgi:hypothetical protein